MFSLFCDSGTTWPVQTSFSNRLEALISPRIYTNKRPIFDGLDTCQYRQYAFCKVGVLGGKGCAPGATHLRDGLCPLDPNKLLKHLLSLLTC